MIDLEDLLQRTSRTFALAIPLLPEPTRRHVGVGYLLFRIADTFEDAGHWPRARRLEALRDFSELLEAPGPAPERAAALARAWVAARPCDHEGYLDLLAQTPDVLAEYWSYAPGARAALGRHARRTADGMAGFVARGSADGSLRLASAQDLRDYCYVVAGIVGELLTELFLDATPALESVRAPLEANARAFGEGLQLVNILKDSADDAREGRVYLPPRVPRAEVFAMARAGLRDARTYVAALQGGGAPRGVVAFCALPVLLARTALDALERAGAGAKVPRDEVFRLMHQLDAALETGRPALGAD